MKCLIILLICSFLILSLSAKRVELESKPHVLNEWYLHAKASPDEKINLLFALKHTNTDKLKVRKKYIFFLFEKTRYISKFINK